MSLSFTKKDSGRPIARLINVPKEDQKILYIHEDEKDGKSSIEIKDGKLQPLPNKKVVEKIYISATSGAGKSTFASKWAKEYKKMFRDDEIYLFSTIDEDEVLDKLDPMRIPINSDLLAEPILPDELSKSLVIFDDVETIRNNLQLRYIRSLIDWLLECGRHFNIRMLITSHMISDYKNTRRILNEATSVVLFPKSGNIFHIKNYLKNYAGLEKSQIKKIIKLPSRWFMLTRGHLSHIIYEKGAYIIQPDEDD